MFRTSEELTHRYAVSVERLLGFAARGNLAMCRRDGALFFDETRVAKLFPSRAALADRSDVASRPGLGALGSVRLGAAAVARD